MDFKNLSKGLFDFSLFKDKSKMYSFFKLDLISKNIIYRIINGSDEFKIKCLTNDNLINLLKFKVDDIINCICSISSDLDKVKCLFFNTSLIGGYYISRVLSSFDDDNIVNFFNKYKGMLDDNNISLYNITKHFDYDKQLSLVNYLDEINYDDLEKKKVLATLDNDVKKDLGIPFTNYCNDSLDTARFGKVIVDLDTDLSVYKGLDELLYFNGTGSYDKEKLYELFKICPNMKIRNNLILGFSSVPEYIEGEKWIDTLLSNVDENWSDVQKLAYVDSSIGKSISYSPDFNTEFHNRDNSRALWKIICSGYGVCNGICEIEKYILDKLNIDSEMVCSEKHAFLKVKNIEINGNVGNTIVDPTWNLTAYKFNGKPGNFCKSYESIRKHDFNSSNVDFACHKNDYDLLDATLELSDDDLREVFNSIGFEFSIKELIDKSNSLFDSNLDDFDNLKRQFDLLIEYCPNFSKFQNESMSILNNFLLNKDFEFGSCVIDRAFSLEDKSCHFFVNIDDSVYYLASDKDFIPMTEDEFFDKYSFYEKDKNKEYEYFIRNGVKKDSIEIER